MNRYRILVVEDDHAIRNGLTDALTVSGYDVLPVKDGYDALNVIHAEDYDLALLDVVLPGASGFDLLRLIREDRATVPILMLTAKGAEADKVRGLKLGADDYVAPDAGQSGAAGGILGFSQPLPGAGRGADCADDQGI